MKNLCFLLLTFFFLKRNIYTRLFKSIKIGGGMK